MILKIITALVGIPLMALIAMLVWTGLRGPTAQTDGSGQNQPAVTLKEQLTDGLFEAQVYLPGDKTYKIDIQFSPEPTSTIMNGMPPEVVMSMVTMGMEGFVPSLELVGAGMWRTAGKLPMAGDWILNVGYGDDFVEVRFNVQ